MGPKIEKNQSCIWDCSAWTGIEGRVELIGALSPPLLHVFLGADHRDPDHLCGARIMKKINLD